MPAPLGAGYTYYWRIRAADGANTGPYSAVSTFSVIPPVLIEAPVAKAASWAEGPSPPFWGATPLGTFVARSWCQDAHSDADNPLRAAITTRVKGTCMYISTRAASRPRSASKA